jgi:hypothetical protein
MPDDDQTPLAPAATPPPRAKGLSKGRRRNSSRTEGLVDTDLPDDSLPATAGTNSYSPAPPTQPSEQSNQSSALRANTEPAPTNDTPARTTSPLLSQTSQPHEDPSKPVSVAPSIEPTQPRTAAAPDATPVVAVEDSPSDPAAEDEATYPATSYILSTALTKVRQLSRRTQQSYAEIAMDAIDRALSEQVLQRLVSHRQIDPRPESSRFPSRKVLRRSPHRAHGGSSRTIWQPRMTDNELRGPRRDSGRGRGR